jgi:ADP-ribose pyrophosphatase
VTTRPIEHEFLLEGRIFAVERCSWTTTDGTRLVREVVRHPGAVTIVPVLDDGRLVLVQNWRIAVGGPLWELPAGKLEPGEPPIDTARRELQEETGYTAECMRPIGRYYTSPGFADELMHAFVATGLLPGEAHPEPGEEVSATAFSLDEIQHMIESGELIDGKTLAALHLWQASREER